jgi:hypothetical protein
MEKTLHVFTSLLELQAQTDETIIILSTRVTKGFISNSWGNGGSSSLTYEATCNDKNKFCAPNSTEFFSYTHNV